MDEVDIHISDALCSTVDSIRGLVLLTYFQPTVYVSDAYLTLRTSDITKDGHGVVAERVSGCYGSLCFDRDLHEPCGAY